MSQRPTMDVEPFQKFVSLVQEHCGGSVRWEPPRQVRYLLSYLKKHPQGAPERILVEVDYVDRHYLEEFTAYYASTLRPPPAQAARFHFFRNGELLDRFTALLEDAANGNRQKVEAELKANYLGCVVVRPIPTAPIGRTMLRPYPEERGRNYQGVIRSCSVHLSGLKLSFDSLPFEQQDQGVGACASVALWASLAKTARSIGARAPTPYSVTSAATKHSLNDRILPASSGLDAGQMAGAIREFGFAPYTVKVSDNPEAFLWTLKVYLRSGIPAILILRDLKEVHAVTVAGHREGTHQLTTIGGEARTLSYRSLERVYVHDDRIGPYVKMDLKPDPEEKAESTDKNEGEAEEKPWRQVKLRRVVVDEAEDEELTRDVRIDLAIFPLYPKLRLSASDLAQIAASLGPLFRMLLGAERAQSLRAEGMFLQNGSYLRELFELQADAKRVAQMAKTTRLSRYVAVIRWYLDDEMLADVVCDTTDIFHESMPYAAILAVFLVSQEQVAAAKSAAKDLIAEDRFF